MVKIYKFLSSLEKIRQLSYISSQISYTFVDFLRKFMKFIIDVFYALQDRIK